MIKIKFSFVCKQNLFTMTHFRPRGMPLPNCNAGN
uniref:Uncharacterized protein n=1 Tax=Rhizophora mucronata TaxID=61149 RepID=A0A2P2QFE1_RHIMU